MIVNLFSLAYVALYMFCGAVVAAIAFDIRDKRKKK